MARSIRPIKLVVSPHGQLRKHKHMDPIPRGWILIHDDVVFYYDELLDIFKYVPFLKESDFDIDQTGGANG